MVPGYKHCLLIGGGHAHVAVLADWIRHGLPFERATLLSPFAHLRYSGTVPGWIAGRYHRDDGVVDLRALAARAGVNWEAGRCVSINPEARIAGTDTGAQIGFDIASIDTGGVGRARRVLGNDPRILDVRPIDDFVERVAEILAERSAQALRIAVVGGGAGGVELAFACRNAAGQPTPPNITLIAGLDGVLPGFSAAVQRTTIKALQAQGIHLVSGDAQLADGVLQVPAAVLEPLDHIIAALGSSAPEWPRASGLACDAEGFIAVDAHQRSLSHPCVFAVGDVAARQDRHVPHSGVHAVFAGPVLARNLRDAAGKKPLARSYRPRWNSLYLISTGDGRAIASYGPLAAHGRWVQRLKHWIDSRWLSKYARLAKPH